MERIIKLLFAIILVANSAYAIPCQDYLAGAKFQKAIKSAHPTGQCGGCFSSLFGDCKPLAKSLLSSKKAPSWRVHGFWSDAHKFGDSNIKALKKDAASWNSLCKQFDLEYSPFCEHNLSNPDKYLDIAQAAAPDCKIVNTPWKGALSKKYKNEVHNPTHSVPSGRYNYSYDGTSVVDDNVEATKKKFASAEKFFYWEPRYNGRWETNDPTKRENRKGWADAKLIKSVEVLAGDKGETKLPAKWIYKSHSENKGTGDSRAEKPVIIAPVKKNKLKVGSVDCKYYGAFDKSRWRYYCPKWGYEIATKPVPLDKYGTVNPAFREGSYR